MNLKRKIALVSALAVGISAAAPGTSAAVERTFEPPEKTANGIVAPMWTLHVDRLQAPFLPPGLGDRFLADLDAQFTGPKVNLTGQKDGTVIIELPNLVLAVGPSC